MSQGRGFGIWTMGAPMLAGSSVEFSIWSKGAPFVAPHIDAMSVTLTPSPATVATATLAFIADVVFPASAATSREGPIVVLGSIEVSPAPSTVMSGYAGPKINYLTPVTLLSEESVPTGWLPRADVESWRLLTVDRLLVVASLSHRFLTVEKMREEIPVLSERRFFVDVFITPPAAVPRLQRSVTYRVELEEP